MKPFLSLIIAISLILISTKSWSNDGNGFNHPGLFHSQNDLDRMREAVKAKEEPIFSGFKILQESLHSKSNYKMQGPFPEWGRAPNIRAGEARNDAKAAYENALMWSITGDKEHAKKAIQIINAWANTLKKVSGIDGVLAAGIQGVKFANAAEILRYSDSGWSEQEAKNVKSHLRRHGIQQFSTTHILLMAIGRLLLYKLIWRSQFSVTTENSLRVPLNTRSMGQAMAVSLI